MKSLSERIYLDHNATTPLHPQVLEAMLPFLRENFGNASSIHAEGRTARAAIDKARSKVAALLGASEEEIYFTGGGTESNNLAIRGVAERPGNEGKHFITSSVEHHAVLYPMQRLVKQGFECTFLPVDRYGRVDPDELKAALRPGETVLVSIIAANNEVGTIQPVEELAEVCREAGVLFHLDAVQVLGRKRLDVGSLPVDMISLSGHKIYGPKGTGALYLRKGVELEPLMLGGSQERRRRPGTENVAGIVGLGEACQLAQSEFEERNRHCHHLRDLLWEGLTRKLEGVHLNGHPTQRLSNTLNVSFEGVEGEALLLNLDLAGIAASSGSACASGSLEPSHVLTAMGVPAQLAQSSVRFSFGRDNTAEQVKRVVQEVSRIVQRLRSLGVSA